jgi:putative salt-induced outer membrane protein YdiY
VVTASSVVRLIVGSLFAFVLTAKSASAQAPAEPPANAQASAAAAPAAPPGPLTGSAGAGLAFTRGNTDTSNINASYDVTYDPKTSNVVKSDAQYLRGKNDGDLTVDHLGFDLRDQYALSSRAFAYGQFQFLRDTFKAIDYLVAPTAGLGYKVVDAKQTTLAVDAGLGGVWEKYPNLARTTSGAFTASEHYTEKLSGRATITQQVTGLWKTSDFSDTLYTFDAALAAALTTKSQLKIEVLDTYSSKPPTPATKGNDVATVFSIGYKF